MNDAGLARESFEWIANKSRPLGLDAAEGEDYIRILEAWSSLLARLESAATIPNSNPET